MLQQIILLLSSKSFFGSWFSADKIGALIAAELLPTSYWARDHQYIDFFYCKQVACCFYFISFLNDFPFSTVIKITKPPPKVGAWSALQPYLDKLLNKALQAPSLGGSCVIPITVLNEKSFKICNKEINAIPYSLD